MCGGTWPPGVQKETVGVLLRMVKDRCPALLVAFGLPVSSLTCFSLDAFEITPDQLLTGRKAKVLVSPNFKG